jgi:hypothetical protein
MKKSLAGEDTEAPDLFAEINRIAEQAKCNFHMDASGKVQLPDPPAPQAPEDTSA